MFLTSYQIFLCNYKSTRGKHCLFALRYFFTYLLSTVSITCQIKKLKVESSAAVFTCSILLFLLESDVNHHVHHVLLISGAVCLHFLNTENHNQFDIFIFIIKICDFVSGGSIRISKLKLKLKLFLYSIQFVYNVILPTKNYLELSKIMLQTYSVFLKRYNFLIIMKYYIYVGFIKIIQTRH